MLTANNHSQRSPLAKLAGDDNSTPPPAVRYPWMDALRAVAIVLVIVLHGTTIPQLFGMPTPAWVDWLNFLASPYRMPLLLMLSGFLLHRSLSKGLPRYYLGKLRHVAWPFLVWTLLLGLVMPMIKLTNPWLWVGDSYLWFLVVIGVSYCLAPITRAVHPAAVCTMLLQVLNLEPPTREIGFRLLWYGAFFYAGAALTQWLPRLLRAPQWVGGSLLAVAVTWTFTVASYYGHVPSILPQYFLLSVVGVLGIIWAAARWLRSNVLEWVGRNSLVFYVSHYPLSVVTWQLVQAHLPLYASYLCMIAVSLAGGALLSTYARASVLFQMPQLRWVADKRSAAPESNTQLATT